MELTDPRFVPLRRELLFAAVAVGGALLLLAELSSLFAGRVWLVGSAAIMGMGFLHAVGQRFTSPGSKLLAWLYVVATAVQTVWSQLVLGAVAAVMLVLALVILQRGWPETEHPQWTWARRVVFRLWPFVAVCGFVLLDGHGLALDLVAALQLAGAFAMGDVMRWGAKARERKTAE